MTWPPLINRSYSGCAHAPAAAVKNNRSLARLMASLYTRRFMTALRISVAFWGLWTVTSFAQDYKAEKITEHDVPIVRLTDAAHGVEVSIVPSIGNRAYEMKVHGQNILNFPATDIGEYQKRPRLSGVPFLAPWADLLSEQAF